MTEPSGQSQEPVGSGTETLLEFPCAFPLKIMGMAQNNLAQEVLAVIHRHAPDYDGKTMEMRASSSGKYVSLTCTINAQSKTQLDELYRALTSHPLVKVVL
jgi:uncharacterized protein